MEATKFLETRNNMEIINILISIIIAFLPILWWAYIFSYIDNNNLNSRIFISWIIAWAISVIPVLYLEKIFEFFSLEKINILYVISSGNFDFFEVFISILLTIFIVWIFMSIVYLLFSENFKNTYKIYLKNFFIISSFSLIFVLISKILFSFNFFHENIKNHVTIWKNIFDTLWLIIIYYIIVWLLEEASKHFWFIASSSKNIINIKKWVLFWVFIALWFWFIENILYLFNISTKSWIWWDFFWVWFFRWLFSLFVHILCSVIVAYWFSRSYLNYPKFLSYFKWVLIAVILSILIHWIYDISLTLWFTLIIFIYFFLWYLYITKIFYKN